MPDYMKMYAVLCKAIDNVIDPLERIPLAQPSVESLKSALHEAEEIYIDSSLYFEKTAGSKIIELKVDTANEK